MTNKDIQKLMQKALLADDYACCESILSQNNIDLLKWRDEYNATALHVALEQKAMLCVDAWSKLDWDWQAVDFRGRTILAEAIRSEHPLWEEMFSKTTIAEGSVEEKEIDEVLIKQDSQEIAIKMVKRGWGLSRWSNTSTGENIYHIAAKRNWSGLLTEILNSGESEVLTANRLRQRNKWGGLPIMSGVREGSIESVRVIVNAMDSLKMAEYMAEIDTSGFDILSAALWHGHLDLAKELERTVPMLSMGRVLGLGYGGKDFGYDWTPWATALVQKNEEIRNWAIQHSYDSWPKAKRVMPWQKLIAINITDIDKLEEIKIQQPKDWGAEWKDVTFRVNGQLNSSATSVAFLNNSLENCKWWVAEAKSPLISECFRSACNSKIDRDAKIDYLINKADRVWKSSQSIHNGTSGIGTIAEVADRASPNILDKMSKAFLWNDDDWVHGWVITAQSVKEKNWSWFNENMPKSAKALLKSYKFNGILLDWIKIFNGLTVKKAAVLKRIGLWKKLTDYLYDYKKFSAKHSKVGMVWAKHAKSHPLATADWWSEISKKALKAKEKDRLAFNEMALACFDEVTKSTKTQWNVAVQMGKTINFGNADRPHEYKSPIASWLRWIALGNIDQLKNAKKLGWFDESHEINNTADSDSVWFPDAIKNEWVVAQAWMAWSMRRPSVKLDTGADPREVADWMCENGMPFNWKYIKAIVHRKDYRSIFSDKDEVPISHQLGWTTGQWRWIFANQKLALEDAPKRPLEWLWLSEDKGFLGDSAIHKKIIKETGVNIWEKDKRGRSLGAIWLSNGETRMQARITKLIKNESPEIIEKLWSENPSEGHPWYLLFKRIMSKRALATDWSLLIEKMRGPKKWLNFGHVKAIYLHYIEDLCGSYEGRRSSADPGPMRLWSKWKAFIVNERVSLSIVSNGVKEKINVPIWFSFIGYSKSLRKKMWSIEYAWPKAEIDATNLIKLAVSDVKEAFKGKSGWGNPKITDYSASELLAGSEMWDDLWKMGFPMINNEEVYNKLAIVPEWSDWWDKKRLSIKYASGQITKKAGAL